MAQTKTPKAPLLVRVPAAELPRLRRVARSEGKPLAAWLRDVLAWYLAERRAGRLEEPPAGSCTVTISPERRVPIPKALLDRLELQPGDRLELAVEGGVLVLTPANEGGSRQ